MKQRAHMLIGAVVGLALVLAFVWWSSAREEPAGADARSTAHGEVVAPHPTRARGGVAARAVDSAAAERTVGGTVLDPESGPLGEGRIDVVCDDHRVVARVTLSEDGRFVAPACPGTTCARLVHPTFEQREAWLLDPGRPRDLEVARARGIEGRVVAAGQAIPNASLLLRQRDARVSGSTDTDGEFALSLPAIRPCDVCDPEGQWRSCRPADRALDEAESVVLVWADGHAPREVEVELSVGEPLELELEAAAAPITGYVRGADGGPIAVRTVVLATNIARAVEQHAALVEADGSFALDDLAAAEYRLRVVRDGVELVTLARAVPGQRVELRAAIDAVFDELELELVDERGQVVVGARVDGGPFRGAVTDVAGRVRAEAVLAGRYPLRIRAPNCPVVRTDLQIESGRGVQQRTVTLTDCSSDAP